MDIRKGNGENILKKFGIAPGMVSDYIIIGIDPGAGEWSAAEARERPAMGVDQDKCAIKDLYVDNASVSVKDATVLYYDKKNGCWHIGNKARNLAQNSKESGDFYVNYKQPPDSPYAAEGYDHDFEAPDYRSLMQTSFRCIIHNLFFEANNFEEFQKESEDGPAEKQKKIFLVVGRPSSSDWENTDLIYRDLLMQDLEIPHVGQANIQMAVVSEAMASLASEIYTKNGIPESCTVVVDVGSSTIDAIVVKDGELAGEYSRQIGAGCIEENLLELALYDDCCTGDVNERLSFYFADNAKYRQLVSKRKELREQLADEAFAKADDPEFFEYRFSSMGEFNRVIQDLSPAILRALLRLKKEEYYGEDGKGGNKGIVQEISLSRQEEPVYLGVNDKTMNKAVYQMPVFVPCTESSRSDDKYRCTGYYRSYYDAVAHFMDGVSEMYLKNETSVHVILTGGASVMPFVAELAREKLGCEPTWSDQPNYTVSRGLAYIGYAELKKREEVGRLKEIARKILQENKKNLAFSTRCAFAEWYVGEEIKDISDWADHGSGTSLSKAWRGTYYYSSETLGEFELVKKWWEKAIQPKVVQKIEQHIRQTYLNADTQYNFLVHPQIVEHAFRKNHSTTVKTNLFDVFGFMGGLTINVNKTSYTQEQRRKYYRKAVSNRSTRESNVRSQGNVRNLADEYAGEIVSSFEQELLKDIEEYVNGLTVYMIRQSSQHGRDGKD